MPKLALALDYVTFGLLLAVMAIAIAAGDPATISLSLAAMVLCTRVIILQIRPHEQP